MSRRAVLYSLIGSVALLASSAARAQLAPVAVWNMDNDFGTTMSDSSGNANDGVTTDVGTSGSGYNFNGSTSLAVVPDSSTLNPGTRDFSFSVQLQTDRVPASGTDYDLMRKGLSGTPGGEFKMELVRSDGKAKAFCLIKDLNAKQASLTGKTDLSDNVLHTITCKRSGTTLSLKVDSLSTQKKSKISVKSISNTAPLLIGAKSAEGTGVDNDFYSGLMRSATVSIAPPAQ